MEYLDLATSRLLMQLGMYISPFVWAGQEQTIHPWDALKFLLTKFGTLVSLLAATNGQCSASCVPFGWFYGATEAEAVAKLVKDIAEREGVA